jgi:hypothetical protein
METHRDSRLLSDRRLLIDGRVWEGEPERAIEAPAVAGLTVRQSRAMASARKPVIVRKFSRDWCAGYAGAEFGQQKAELEFLDLTGKVVRMGWEQVKWICYVRDFPAGPADQANPERLVRKRFSLRPRTAGLWLRLTLGDGDELEGPGGQRPFSGGGRRAAADPARYALEYAADLRASAGDTDS